MSGDSGCTIVHVDMDAFFASVAIRDRPELAGLPVVIGGGTRGVVLSATYPARRFGIRSAMPMTRARRLCPQAIVVSPDYDEIAATSAAVMETFRSVTPVVEPVSMDEAFLDIAGALRHFRSATEVGEYLRARIADEQRITCSVGIGPNPQLAKLASRRAKPDGLFVVARDQVTAFLHPLDVGELWGVGEKTAERLYRLGITTVGDLAHTPVAILRRALGPVAGGQLHATAWGVDTRRVVAKRGHDEPDRSMGADETFGRDVDDPAVVYRELLRLSAKLAFRLRSAGVSGRTVTLRVRFADFTTITRSRTLRESTNQTQVIHATAASLYTALGLERARLRLVGVRVEGLVDASTAPRQVVLGERAHGWEDLERAADLVVSRFGTDAVRRASLVDERRP